MPRRGEGHFPAGLEGDERSPETGSNDARSLVHRAPRRIRGNELGSHPGEPQRRGGFDVLPVTWASVRVFLHVAAATVWVGGQLTLAGLVPGLRAFGADAGR